MPSSYDKLIGSIGLNCLEFAKFLKYLRNVFCNVFIRKVRNSQKQVRSVLNAHAFSFLLMVELPSIVGITKIPNTKTTTIKCVFIAFHVRVRNDSLTFTNQVILCNYDQSCFLFAEEISRYLK